MMRGSVLTTPPGAPFLRSLATAIVTGALSGGRPPEPDALSRITVLLPTRRAGRALERELAAAVKAVHGRTALLLPTIRPLLHPDPDAGLFAGAGVAIEGANAAAGPEDAVSDLERLTVLTGLVERWSQTLRARLSEDDPSAAVSKVAGARTPAEAVGLARELIRLMDLADAEEIDLATLRSGDLLDLPESLSAYWQQTLDFLSILVDAWPAYLAERGLVSPARREARLLREEAQRIRSHPPTDLLIAAGLTRTTPAVRAVLKAVLAAPMGRIVLQGFAVDPAARLDDDTFAALLPSHPEHGEAWAHRLLADLEVARGDVALIPGAAPEANAILRQRFITEALRPSSSTHLWRPYIERASPAKATAALDGLELIEAETEAEEARTIALILAAATHQPAQVAALVTPNRALARRVAAELDALGIAYDDSGGLPLHRTRTGSFLACVLEAVRHRLSPHATMTLLNHPLTRLRLPRAEVERGAAALELAVLRGIYIGEGLEGLRARFDLARAAAIPGERRHPAVARLGDEDLAAAEAVLQGLEHALAPFLRTCALADRSAFGALHREHIAAAEAIAADETGSSAVLWSGSVGEAIAALSASVLDASLPPLLIPPRHYAETWQAIVSDVAFRPRTASDARVMILGPLEARLLDPDVLVLGSLADGVWPEAADTGPWLSRPTLAALGLPPPEERIGLSAHDVVKMLERKRVIMTRPEKIDGAPAEPSRWLVRLDALARGLGIAHPFAPARPWLGWSRARGSVPWTPLGAAPAPRPALNLRPRKLSVSAVERWLTNPYALYAEYILRLPPLPPLGEQPGPALRGMILHAGLAIFAKCHPDQLPADIAGELMRHISAELEAWSGSPRIAAVWASRFARFSGWFAATEPARRAAAKATRVNAEVPGKMVLAGPAGPFELSARADRIDATSDGLVIYDYKTGGSLDHLVKRAQSGAAPQLPLEAAIAAAGGFSHVPAVPVTGLAFIAASGGEPPGAVFALDGTRLQEFAAEAQAGLERLIAHFDDPATPYAAVRRPKFRYDYDAFEHLARVKEWLGTGEEEAAP